MLCPTAAPALSWDSPPGFPAIPTIVVYRNREEMFMHKLVCTGFAALVLLAACSDARRGTDCSGGMTQCEIPGVDYAGNSDQRSLYLLR